MCLSVGVHVDRSRDVGPPPDCPSRKEGLRLERVSLYIEKTSPVHVQTESRLTRLALYLRSCTFTLNSLDQRVGFSRGFGETLTLVHETGETRNSTTYIIVVGVFQ